MQEVYLTSAFGCTWRGMRIGGGARRRRHTLVRVSPYRCMARLSGVGGLLLRVRGSVSWQRALRVSPGRDGRVRFDEEGT
jgi:hypothetical protein